MRTRPIPIVKAIKVRDGSPLDVPMLLFTWKKQKDMHVSAGEKPAEDKEKRKKKSSATGRKFRTQNL